MTLFVVVVIIVIGLVSLMGGQIIAGLAGALR